MSRCASAAEGERLPLGQAVAGRHDVTPPFIGPHGPVFGSGFAHNRLELVRTGELLHRQLLSPPAVVLDVSGGIGVYAACLAGRGYRVDLVCVRGQWRDYCSASSPDR